MFASRLWLAEHINEIPVDALSMLSAAAERAQSSGDDTGAQSLALLAELLNEARRIGVNPSYYALIGESAFHESSELENESGTGATLRQQVAAWITWIDVPDLDMSRAHLKEHAATMLTDGAEQLLIEFHDMLQTDKKRRVAAEILQLLRDARMYGIDAAYEMLLNKTRGPSTGNAEMDSLFADLQHLDNPNADPLRRDEIYRRILQIDSHAHVLDARSRGEVLIAQGEALRMAATRVGGQEHITFLRGAIACADEATQVCRRDDYPLVWAGALNNKGMALRELADRLGGADSAQALREAITCYDQSLLEQRRETTPLNWAGSLSNKETRCVIWRVNCTARLGSRLCKRPSIALIRHC